MLTEKKNNKEKQEVFVTSSVMNYSFKCIQTLNWKRDVNHMMHVVIQGLVTTSPRKKCTTAEI